MSTEPTQSRARKPEAEWMKRVSSWSSATQPRKPQHGWLYALITCCVCKRSSIGRIKKADAEACAKGELACKECYQHALEPKS